MSNRRRKSKMRANLFHLILINISLITNLSENDAKSIESNSRSNKRLFINHDDNNNQLNNGNRNASKSNNDDNGDARKIANDTINAFGNLSGKRVINNDTLSTTIVNHKSKYENSSNMTLNCPNICKCQVVNTTTSQHFVTECLITNSDFTMKSISTRTTDLTIVNNKFKKISENDLKELINLKSFNVKGINIENFQENMFVHLTELKTLMISESRKITKFPNLSKNENLEHLRIDRTSIKFIPSKFCNWTPKVTALIVKSTNIINLPILDKCRELKLIDLSYNQIENFYEEGSFINQAKLIDLFLSHNQLKKLTANSFVGLKNLRILDLQNNLIVFIDQEAFKPLTQLRDLNLGNNKLKSLPTLGLQNIRQIKIFGNPLLTEFPEREHFPKVHTLALSYAYHCCQFRDLNNQNQNRNQQSSTHSTSPTSPVSLEENIIWLEKDDVDLSIWNTNVTDIWPGYKNFSPKFDEIANQLWKPYEKEHMIPDNLAQYAEEYFEDYRPVVGFEDNFLLRYPVKCFPQPTTFMPCEDLFDWWSLRCGVWIVFLLALLGNGVVVVVLLFGRSKLDVPRFLVFNLALADFFMGMYLGLLAVVDAGTFGEFRAYAIPWQTSGFCQFAGFLGVLSSELSVYTLAVITLERNYAITHAMHLNKRLSLKHAAYIMLVGWTFALLMAVLPLFGISDYRKFAVCLPFEVSDRWSLTFVLTLIFINGLAFLILMACYLRMYCAIRGSQAWNSNDSRIAKRMALLVFTDFLCWSPIAFFSLTSLAGLNLVSLNQAKVLTVFILPLNSCANPFLYAIFTKQFKKDCVFLCKRIEESRVTRGMGRCRMSSNFSNRHTPVSSNSAIEKKSEREVVCGCGHPLTQRIESNLITNESKFKRFANKFFRGRRKNLQELRGSEFIAEQTIGTKTKEARRFDSISSGNFSSRSDSWKVTANIPMRVLETHRVQANNKRRSSWTASSTTASSTLPRTSTTRSSVSSESSTSNRNKVTHIIDIMPDAASALESKIKRDKYLVRQRSEELQILDSESESEDDKEIVQPSEKAKKEEELEDETK